MKSFFFYDLETSGTSAKTDRIMQFAGQRTDLQLSPLGGPVNLLVKLPDDTLPSIGAVLITKITPQQTQADGLTEAELCQFLTTKVFTAGTVAIGYNSVRFDDEMMRALFWRNFYDPYEWHWREGRGRFDMLDVVRMTRALRPEGINWPVTTEGAPTVRLELLSKANGIEHLSAHDALSDVEALIGVTKLIYTKQPKLFNYLLEMRDKKRVGKIVSISAPMPFVYTSGRYGGTYNFTTVAYPIGVGENGGVIVYDLRYNFEELLANTEVKEGPRLENQFYPVIKELKLNKCPAVAPLAVLQHNQAWEKLELTPEQVNMNLEILLKHRRELAEISAKIRETKDWSREEDPESMIYAGFVQGRDKTLVEAVRNADASKLADFTPNFADERLPELLVHYKARNFPQSLNLTEQLQWQEYRKARLLKQSERFLAELEQIPADADQFLIEELKLWYQAIMDFSDENA